MARDDGSRWDQGAGWGKAALPGELRRLESAFESMQGLDSSQQRERLAEIRQTDPSVYAQLMHLMHAQSRMGDFLAERTVDWNAIVSRVEVRGEIEQTGHGMDIPPYRMLRTLGMGGCGTVYLARQESPIQRDVAIKVLNPETAARAFVARFETERQLLAMLDHPHIAKVFDAGTTAMGTPYYVMEFVDGETLQTYCESRAATIGERLRLFCQVLEAVQHAHTKGVVHRDIKPSNVMVREGHARVIDFGIAKLMRVDAMSPSHASMGLQLVGTPEYMSPEQVEAAPDVDVRTDIYSLGCMLYQLLTGVTPLGSRELRAEGLASLRQLVCEVVPPVPSERVHDASWRAALQKDLDWIVMRAIEKDRSRRYQTAREFMQDIAAHLGHRPIAAAPPSIRYLLGKMYRRHRLAMILAGGTAAAVMLGAGSTMLALHRATQHRLVAEQARERSELDAYAANIRAAESALEAGDIQRASVALAVAPPHLRRVEWDVLHARCDESDRVLRGHTGRVVGAKYAPDGETLLSWDGLGGVFLWRGDRATQLQQHSSEVRRAVFMPDGKRAVTASLDSLALVHDIESGRTIASLAGHNGAVEDVDVSSDGSMIATVSGDGTAMIWDAATLSRSCTIVCSTQLVRFGKFSRDGNLLATGGDSGVVQVWKPRTGELVAVLEATGSAVTALAFAPDGTQVAIGYESGEVVRWRLTPHTSEIVWKSARRVHDCQVSGDGSRFAAATATGEVVVCMLEAGTEPVILRGHAGEVFSCRFSADSKLLATTSADTTVRVWDAESGEVLRVLRGHADAVFMAAFADQSHHIATTSGDSTVRIWRNINNDPGRLRGHRDILRDVQLNHAGSRVWTTALDGTARLWDIRTGQQLITYTHEHATPPGVYRAALSPDESLLLTTGQNGLARLWNANSGELSATLVGHTASVTYGEFVDDGRQVLTSSVDGTLRLWDVANGKELVVARGHTSRVRDMAVSDDGELVATASDDGTVRVWRTKNSELVLVLKGHTRAVLCVAFSPVGTKLATAGMDRSLLLWDTSSGDLLAKAAGHSDAVRVLRFTPDGSRVVSGSADTSICVWDVQNGGLVAKLDGHGGTVRTMVVVGSDRIISGANDGTVRVWCLRTYRELATLASGLGAVSQMRISSDGSRLIASCDDRTAHVIEMKQRSERSDGRQ